MKEKHLSFVSLVCSGGWHVFFGNINIPQDFHKSIFLFYLLFLFLSLYFFSFFPQHSFLLTYRKEGSKHYEIKAESESEINAWIRGIEAARSVANVVKIKFFVTKHKVIYREVTLACVLSFFFHLLLTSLLATLFSFIASSLLDCVIHALQCTRINCCTRTASVNYSRRKKNSSKNIYTWCKLLSLKKQPSGNILNSVKS